MPTAVNTGEDALLTLQAALKSIAEKGTSSHLKTIKQLDEHLDDWAKSWIRDPKRTPRDVDAIRAYQRLLVFQWAVTERKPHADILEYNRRWMKAVAAGEIDMFAPDAELNLILLHKVQAPNIYTSQASTKPHKPKADKPPPKATAGAPPAPAKYPAGSCAHHSNSTSHTTEQCIKKGA